MSIAPRPAKTLKVLTDLEKGPTRISIDMQDLKDLKSRFFKSDFADATDERCLLP